jgi:peptide-methionine (S)-S-oxide reductase
VPGVTDAAVGYTGGTTSNPSYRQICTGATGHAEVVEVTFDPQRVTYERLVDIFFKIHDPTTLNRQGPDVGDQYRSVIFCHSDDQRKVAESMKDKAGKSGRYKNPIVTFVEPAPNFWRAEEYHQRYFEKNGGPSCHVLPE